MKNKLAIAFLSLSLALTGCKPSVEGESARYTQITDRLSALATKNPAMKPDITTKLAEFAKAKTEADAKAGEEKAKALRELNNRIAAYEATLAPATPAADASKLGDKLGSAGSGSAGSAGSGSGSGSGSAAPATGGKLGGGSGSAGSAAGSGSGSAAKSGFGSDTGSAKSGFGGK